MEQFHNHQPISYRTTPSGLRQRLIERAREPGALGEVGRLLRDTADLLEIETNTRAIEMAHDFHDRYGYPAVAGLIADLRPSKSTWIETVFAAQDERVGFLCIGAGTGALELYVAYAEAGEPVTVEFVAGMRKQTNWWPAIDWNQLANGTWMPSTAWRRRAKTWLGTHFQTRALEPSITLRMCGEANFAMFSAFMALAIMHSPLFMPRS